MHLYDLPSDVPWLSLIWLTMLVPAIIMMFLKPEQKQAIRVIGTGFAPSGYRVPIAGPVG